MTYNKVLERLVQERGFVIEQADPPVPLFECVWDDLPTISVPDGCSVQGVSNLDDGRLRAAVTCGAFGSNADWEAYVAEYAQFIGSAVCA